MPPLAAFIRANIEPILSEWEDFARSLPTGRAMDIAGLRDHAREMLGVIARDLETPQTRRAQVDKSKGRSDANGASVLTAAQEHGAGRAVSGFTVADMISEFRALRASVVHLWGRQQREVRASDLADLTRFNEAIDQAIAESITRFTEEVDHARELFLAILGHDLRTPLGAIITSSLFILEEHDLDDPHRALMGTIASSARRVNQMVEDLLGFTRSRFGDGIPIVRTEAALDAIVRDVLAEVTASHPARRIELEADGDLRGRWDPDRLMQAFTNLVGNAAQHGAPDAPITVAARGEREDVVVTVHNTGPLISPGEVGLLFEGITRAVADDGQHERHHLGLGLHIVDMIVTGHGGSIDVESSESEGTTFRVRLPRTE